MALPVGVAVGQGQGVPIEFSMKRGTIQRTYPLGMVSVASRGAAVKRTGNAGQVDIAGAGILEVAGVLGQDVYDPSLIPAPINENIYADGVLTYSQINQPTSVWKDGEAFTINVSGLVNYGDYLAPAAGGQWVSTGAVNTLTSGWAICEVPNSVAGGAIQFSFRFS